MMKKAVLAGAAALTLLDISASTPAQAQGVTNPFAGIYVGGHIGHASAGSTNFTSSAYSFIPPVSGVAITIPGRNDEFDLGGEGVGGVHSGFNFVTPGNVLFGFEGGWTRLGHDDTVTFNSGFISFGGGDGAIFQHRSELELEWQGTLRGRLGIVNGNWLFFTTAGVAFMRVDWDETATFLDCGADGCGNANDVTTVRNHSDSETLTGVAVGGGLEFAATPNIIIGGDYLYENFESFGSAPFGHTNPAQIGNIDDLDVHKVRFRVSVKFDNLLQ